MVLALSKDGSFRYCADYRKINQEEVKNAFDLPTMHECINSLGRDRIFAALDANS